MPGVAKQHNFDRLVPGLSKHRTGHTALTRWFPGLSNHRTGHAELNVKPVI